MDGTQPLIIKINDAGRICDISASAAALLERPAEELIGEPSLKIVHAPDVRKLREAYWHAVQNPMARTTISARILMGNGELLVTEFVLMNLGSQAAPDMLAELRPVLPEPPMVEADSAAQERAAFHHAEMSEGLAHLQQLLDTGSNDFLAIMIAINDVDDHLDELLVELGNRLQTSIRGTDKLFRKSHTHFMLAATGVRDRQELSVLIDRLRACLSFPYTLSDGETIVATGSIGIGLPKGSPTPEFMVHSAETQLRLAAAQEGPFPYRVERRARPRV